MNAWEEKILDRQEPKKEECRKIAIKLKAMDLTIEQIKEVTDLSESEINDL